MAAKIQIICTTPGMRRNGVEHPQTATYEIGRWTDDELKAFRADANFIVQEIDDEAVVTKSAEFDQAVRAEVEKVDARYRAAFEDAVKSAVEAKLKEPNPEMLAMADGIKERDDKIKQLEADLAAATAAKAGQKK